ncbi:hypothetical protein RF11_09350 [Thelohanellus kitauei]|uniref:Uncharacterized protein n=1 Tax=Thelohanellus kitauei TaxID=669202 RepID=A0A0C2IXW3_THEKT|nr:hypothetical protein RF11_09350 [Thelohanellus kitauei]
MGLDKIHGRIKKNKWFVDLPQTDNEYWSCVSFDPAKISAHNPTSGLSYIFFSLFVYNLFLKLYFPTLESQRYLHTLLDIHIYKIQTRIVEKVSPHNTFNQIRIFMM